MTADEFKKELLHYISQNERFLNRFIQTRDSLFLEHAAENQFTQFMSEVVDFLGDELVDSTPALRINAIYDQGTRNFLNQASHNCVTEVLGELRALERRVNRNPKLLRADKNQSATKVVSTSVMPVAFASLPPTILGITQRVFVSHCSEDKLLVESLVDDVLQTGLGLNTVNDIYCTSIDGLGNEPGADFRERIHSQLHVAEVFVAVISKAYLSSAICMNELGAAWILGRHIIPVLLPPLAKGPIGVLLEPKHQILADEASEMATLKDLLDKKLRIPNSSAAQWTRGLSKFASVLSAVPTQEVTETALDIPEKIYSVNFDNGRSDRMDGIKDRTRILDLYSEDNLQRAAARGYFDGYHHDNAALHFGLKRLGFSVVVKIEDGGSAADIITKANGVEFLYLIIQFNGEKGSIEPGPGKYIFRSWMHVQLQQLKAVPFDGRDDVYFEIEAPDLETACKRFFGKHPGIEWQILTENDPRVSMQLF